MSIEQDDMKRLYAEALEEFGPDDYRSIIWRDPAGGGAKYRYDKMMEYYDFEGKVVIELGCGFGSYVRLGYPYREYIGFDIMPELVKVANEKRKEDAIFIVGDIETIIDKPLKRMPDVIIVSGVTGNRGGPTWYPATMDKLFAWLMQNTKVAMINFPSTWATCRHEGMIHYSPGEVLSSALKHTRKVNLDHSYVKSDFLLVMEADEEFESD